MRAATILLCGALAACTSPELVKPEATWQVVHAVDVMQTLKGPGSDPCYIEGNAITRQFIGTRPQPPAIMAWGVGLSVLHWAVGSWLEEHAPRVWAVWELVTITEAGVAVYNNQKAGVRLGAPNVCSKL